MALCEGISHAGSESSIRPSSEQGRRSYFKGSRQKTTAISLGIAYCIISFIAYRELICMEALFIKAVAHFV